MRCRIGTFAVGLAALTISFLAPVLPSGGLANCAGAVQEADVDAAPTEELDPLKATAADSAPSPNKQPTPSPGAEASPPPEPAADPPPDAAAVEAKLNELQEDVELARHALQNARDAAERARSAEAGLTSATLQTNAAAQQANSASQQANNAIQQASNSIQLANEAGEQARGAAELATKSTAEAATAAQTAKTAGDEASTAAGKATAAAKQATEAVDELKESQLPIEPWQATLLVGLLIVLLCILFFLLLWWSNRLEQTSYLGELYSDTLEEVEHKRLVTRMRESRDFLSEVERDTEWLQTHPHPGERPRRPPGTGSGTGGGTGSGYGSIGPTSGLDARASQPKEADETYLAEQAEQERAQRKEQDEYFQKLDVFEKAEKTWLKEVDAEAQRRERLEVDELREEAKRRTKLASKVDFAALRGRGPEFVLEFTAVVVIIFSAVMLGIIGTLDSQQIGTLLAAIAGYVLGRATTRTTKHEGEGQIVTETVTRTPPQSTELAELLRAVAGTAVVPDQPPSVSFSEPALTGQECAVSTATIAIAGTAKDDRSVVEVQWSNSATQESGQAILSDGTTSRSWGVQDLALNPGPNEITVKAKDASGNLSEPSKINVKFTPPKPESTKPESTKPESTKPEPTKPAAGGDEDASESTSNGE